MDINSSQAPAVASAPSAVPATAVASPEPVSIRHLVERSLDDDQAEDVIVIDLEGKSAIADYLVIASGRNGRHVGAMADHLRDKLKDAGYGECAIEGMPQCDWVLVDGGDIIVHLFRPEVRAFYNIEKMWGVEGPSLVTGDFSQRLLDD